MIVCPNCNHQNPDAALQCEQCFTPLPTMTNCPNCAASVQADASFCGQCGFNLQAGGTSPAAPLPATVAPDFNIPELPAIEPLVSPEPLVAGVGVQPDVPEVTPGISSPPGMSSPPGVSSPAEVMQPQPQITVAAATPALAAPIGGTQLQMQTARLLHVQTDNLIELPPQLAVIHIGKPNDRIPPDIDVSGFPNSEIVSRIHADIRLEGDTYFIEDVGSSNGTYINNTPLPMGNRHRLRSGDRIALGKGDKVSFLFQLSH